MKAHKALRALILLGILTVSFLTPSLLSPPVSAQSSTGQTTLYFTDALGLLDEENLSEYGFMFLSTTSPTKQNDSLYPPSLFIKNTSKIIPRLNLNMDEWFTWFGSTWLLYFLQDSPEFNFSELFPGLDLFFPHPYRVVEGYSYEGNDSIEIKGDVIFNLYFHSDIKSPRFHDNVKVELYSLNIDSFLPKLLKNTTVELTPPRGSDVYKQQVVLTDVSYTLIPGDSLLCSVEIIPSNKTIPTLITKLIDVDKFLSRWEGRANWLENRSRLQRIQDLGTTLKDMISILKEGFVNITSEDFAAVINSMQSTSFVYDSVKHASSVIVPARLSEVDIRNYYLHADQTMDEKPPRTTNQSQSQIKLTELLWSGPVLERNKILKVGNSFVDLYINHRDLFRLFALLRKKITITVTLYDNNVSIATAEQTLDRMKIFGLLKKPTSPITFEFTGSEREITYGHSLRLGVAVQNGTKLGFRTVNLFYDSIYFPSAVRVEFTETQNIKISALSRDPLSGLIIPGETITYTLNVTSKKQDTLSVTILEREKTGEWEISVPDSVDVAANSKTTLTVVVQSTDVFKDAYGSVLDFAIIVGGRTGIDRKETTAEVSQEAIQYDVEILKYSPSINISRGENRFFYFVIKNNNTGAVDDVDSYTITASSKNNWPLIPQQTIRNLKIGDTTDADDAKVLIEVPENTTEPSDEITITVKSDSNSAAYETITITVHVIGGGVFEELLDFFDSAARELGLTDIFGSDAGLVLIILLVVIILFILIILALVLTIQSVKIICTDRIKEIEGTEQAVFNITLKNPLRKTQTFDVETKQTAPEAKWVTTIEPSTLILEGRASKTIQVIVTPTEKTEVKDWNQIEAQVKKTGHKKKESITLLAMMKEGTTLLQIKNVSHWPTQFSPGEKVITSFSLSNNGTIAARNAKIFFYLNGKQKNVVEVTLPIGNIADIQIPWIAEKGKNRIRIRVKE